MKNGTRHNEEYVTICLDGESVSALHVKRDGRLSLHKLILSRGLNPSRVSLSLRVMHINRLMPDELFSNSRYLCIMVLCIHSDYEYDRLYFLYCIERRRACLLVIHKRYVHYATDLIKRWGLSRVYTASMLCNQSVWKWRGTVVFRTDPCPQVLFVFNVAWFGGLTVTFIFLVTFVLIF